MGARKEQNMVASLVTERMKQLHQICRRYQVERLRLFGSAVSGSLRPDSDLDFLVEFQEEAPACGFHPIQMMMEMNELFDRRVDLVQFSAIANPFFREEAEETATLIYGTENRPAKPDPPGDREVRTANRRIKICLYDILDSARTIRRYAAGKTAEDYYADELLGNLVERRLTVICEAMRKLNRTNPEIIAKFTKHREIIGFRTLLAHLYMKIDHRRTWDIVENHLPVLEVEAERELNDLD